MQGLPITPGNGRSDAWNRLVHLIGRHLLLFAAAVGISFALIYVEMTTRLFFSFNAPRQIGDPCLTLIRPTTGPDAGALWSNFGDCPNESRDPDREMIIVDLRYRLLLHYKTEPVLAGVLPWPFTRVLRNRDPASRAFGTGGTHSYDIGLVGDAPRLSWVDLVLAGGGTVHYLPVPGKGWFDSEVGGYFGDTTLRWVGDHWRIQRDDGIELLFPESQNATRLEQAALVGMQTSDGDAVLVVDRDPAGNILSLSAGGRRLDFSHDTVNRVTGITTTDTGEHLRLDYDSTGCLVRRIGPGGAFRYDYDPTDGDCRLNRIVHDGVTSFQARYNADDRLIRLTDPAGGVYSLFLGDRRRRRGGAYGSHRPRRGASPNHARRHGMLDQPLGQLSRPLDISKGQHRYERGKFSPWAFGDVSPRGAGQKPTLAAVKRSLPRPGPLGGLRRSFTGTPETWFVR